MHTTTNTALELVERKKAKQEIFITSCALLLANNMLFVCETHEECEQKALKFNQYIVNSKRGYFTNDGKFYDMYEAGVLMYRLRKTPHLCSPLLPEHIF